MQFRFVQEFISDWSLIRHTQETNVTGKPHEKNWCWLWASSHRITWRWSFLFSHMWIDHLTADPPTFLWDRLLIKFERVNKNNNNNITFNYLNSIVSRQIGKTQFQIRICHKYWCEEKKCVHQMGKIGENNGKDKANEKEASNKHWNGGTLFTHGVGCILLYNYFLFCFLFV